MEKVKIDKKTFEALEKWKETKVYPFKTAMKLKAKGTPFISSDFLPLNNLDIEELAKCLIVGYELEETPEEKALNYFNKYDDYCDVERECKFAMLNLLNKLEIKVKGINS